jgi:hypothetical protein
LEEGWTDPTMYTKGKGDCSMEGRGEIFGLVALHNIVLLLYYNFNTPMISLDDKTTAGHASLFIAERTELATLVIFCAGMELSALLHTAGMHRIVIDR